MDTALVEGPNGARFMMDLTDDVLRRIDAGELVAVDPIEPEPEPVKKAPAKRSPARKAPDA